MQLYVRQFCVYNLIYIIYIYLPKAAVLSGLIDPVCVHIRVSNNNMSSYTTVGKLVWTVMK